MIKNFQPAAFIADHTLCSDPHDRDVILCFEDNKILLCENKRLPTWSDFNRGQLLSATGFYCFGSLHQQRYLLCDQQHPVLTNTGLNWHPVKLTFGLLEEADYQIAGLGCQLHHWRNTHRYCGSCGAQTLDKSNERAKECPHCHCLFYPSLYPCIIVLVRRNTELLLARSPHFQPGVYSTLAGFIEPGESAEHTVLREVREEVNLTVDNIRYQASQPWPFPNSLMLGFFADFKEGEINIDALEIEDAQWFKPSQLPKLPSAASISHWLIKKHLMDINTSR